MFDRKIIALSPKNKIYLKEVCNHHDACETCEYTYDIDNSYSACGDLHGSYSMAEMVENNFKTVDKNNTITLPNWQCN